MKMEAEAGVIQIRNAWSHQKLGEARKEDSPLEPLEKAWPYQHLDFRSVPWNFERKNFVVLNY